VLHFWVSIALFFKHAYLLSYDSRYWCFFKVLLFASFVLLLFPENSASDVFLNHSQQTLRPFDSIAPNFGGFLQQRTETAASGLRK